MPAATKKTTPTPAAYPCPYPLGTLISIGGHEQKRVSLEADADMADDTILRRVVEEVGTKGSILILPIASDEPEEAAEDYVKVFGELGCSRVEVLNIQNREDAESEESLRLLNEAGGVMFTGGDQLRITALLGGTAFHRRLKERYTQQPFVIAGTSAGATAMSTPMIYQGRNNAGMRKDEIHITTGLEFLHNVAIDTHFVARGRIVRMAQIIATNPACIGLGLEEDTAVVVTQGRELEVIGSGLVVVLDGMSVTQTNIHEVEPGHPFSIRDLRLHLLSSGERYTLPIIEQMHV
ncbi:cyanophycinase [Hymenobacter sp. BT186]|uniref:Cyanophycinase n=1 Tax=Hymenobacter telluris TaxID=2816474 RepID=A0A939J7Z8_9BACT|nr:cyanophycinase [Hymenobacter telluris]MBO0357234.1 cyanophycinase [Hymenobacter telluris]MBW3373260.1 cyanophycinase [Hymenobacter norwichensis]